ncbi:MAG TPA: PA2169 family four-helix-bundle protein [Blastocatellia bacterium]
MLHNEEDAWARSIGALESLTGEVIWMDNKEINDALNDLIQTCIDSAQGFTEAANNVKSPELHSLFTKIADDRSGFAGELKREVLAIGGDPETSGSAGAAVHRAWMGIVGTLTGKNDHSILAEAERGEDSAVSAYKKALAEPMPSSVRNLVDRQFRIVIETHDRIKQMRDAKTTATGRR